MIRYFTPETTNMHVNRRVDILALVSCPPPSLPPVILHHKVYPQGYMPQRSRSSDFQKMAFFLKHQIIFFVAYFLCLDT